MYINTQNRKLFADYTVFCPALDIEPAPLAYQPATHLPRHVSEDLQNNSVIHPLPPVNPG